MNTAPPFFSATNYQEIPPEIWQSGARAVFTASRVINVLFSGFGVIRGNVTIRVNGVDAPAMRRVLCLDYKTKMIIHETWSNDNGEFIFSGLIPGHRYLILSDDHAEEFNDVVAARITAVEE